MNPALLLRMRRACLVDEGGEIIQFNFRKCFQLAYFLNFSPALESTVVACARGWLAQNRKQASAIPARPRDAEQFPSRRARRSAHWSWVWKIPREPRWTGNRPVRLPHR